jgi:cytochrome c-type biogenesis protein CcmH
VNTFLLLAGALAALAALLIALPWTRARRGTGRAWLWPVLGSLILVAAAGGLYARLSTWNWQQGAAQTEASETLARLRQATTDRPNDLSAWLQLGQAYLLGEQLAPAQRAFERANRIAGGRNADALSGLGETIALGNDSADPALTARAGELFERALQLDPHAGRALLYTAVMALRNGDLTRARARFATLRDLDAPPDLKAALSRQIAALDEQLKPAQVDEASAIHIEVSVADAVRARIPPGASLFVFVRAPGGGAPLAVKRLAATFPQKVVLSANDAMLAGNGVKPGQAVNLVARLSASGSPIAQSGDLFGAGDAVAGQRGERRILIDQIAP